MFIHSNKPNNRYLPAVVITSIPSRSPTWS